MAETPQSAGSRESLAAPVPEAAPPGHPVLPRTFGPFDAVTVVGLTAGTSTPDDVIDRVEARIREIEAAGVASPPLPADASQ